MEVAVNSAKEELQAAQFSIKEDIKSKDLATKSDIRESELRLQKEIEMVKKEIANSKNQIILWISSLLVASGLIQHFFK